MRRTTKAVGTKSAADTDNDEREPYIGTNYDKTRKIYLKDVMAERHEFVLKYSETFLRFVKRRKMISRSEDLSLFLVFLECFAFVVIPAISMIACRTSKVSIVLTWFVLTRVFYFQRFMLALHYHSHRKIFPRGIIGRIANAVPTLIIAPMFGIPSGIYWFHHCAMHHVHGNRKGMDLSSTENYQRDSFNAFVKYWLRFALFAPIELPINIRKYRGLKDGFMCFMCSLVTFSFYLYLRWNVSRVCANWILAYPYILATLALMFGNWSQHVFVCPLNPRNDFKSTYTCINSFENQKTFDDGYHVQHHLDSRLHWTKFAVNFCTKQSLEKHAKEDALVFDGLHFFDVGLCVMLGRFSYLAERLVVLDAQKKKRTKEEIIEELRRRCEPVQF